MTNIETVSKDEETPWCQYQMPLKAPANAITHEKWKQTVKLRKEETNSLAADWFFFYTFQKYPYLGCRENSMTEWNKPRTEPNSSSSFPLLFFFLMELGFELKALAANRRSTSWATTPVHFALVILEMGSFKLFLQSGLKSQSSWSLPPK
jgi:hypothetical protein